MNRQRVNRPCCAVVLYYLLLGATQANAQILIDTFNDGNDDGWQRIDATIGDPWGPGTFDASSGSYRLQGADDVPSGQKGVLNSAFQGSTDPAFKNGFLRTTLRTNNDTLLYLGMRGDVETSALYVFGATAETGNFFWNKIVNDEIVDEGSTIATGFGVGEDWVLEAGTVGDQLSMKAWRLGEPEPPVPQWTHVDATSISGSQFGVGANHGAVLPPSTVNATFDDIYFTPSMWGDYDGDAILTADDIDLLTAELLSVEPRFWYDLNGDRLVTREDHKIWVKDLKHTWYGDADLNGEFNSSDMVQVFDTGTYEKGWIDDEGAIHNGAGWQDGDWNADGMFDSGDMVTAFADGGYEKGPRTDAVAVPEPSGWLLLILGVASLLTARRPR